LANIKEIKERINSISDTKKITNAMYLISSTKLRKARKLLGDTEPFFYATKDMIERLVTNLPEGVKNVFLESKEEIPEEKKRRGYIVFTDDKGLAGSYNHNVIRAVEERLLEDKGNYKLYVIGEVGRYHFISRNMPVDQFFMFTSANPTLHRARKISAEIVNDYQERTIDEFYICYTAMKGGTCETRFEKLLPLDFITQLHKETMEDQSFYRDEFLMEPSPSAILDNIVPNYITGFIYGALVEAFCSVQHSRMQAMDSANKNAEMMLESLKRSYNRQRQAMITQEITEVVSGAKALKRSKEAKMKAMKRQEVKR
jgi:F-type H+-transporting ATPase subunit gamma